MKRALKSPKSDEDDSKKHKTDQLILSDVLNEAVALFNEKTIDSICEEFFNTISPGLYNILKLSGYVDKRDLMLKDVDRRIKPGALHFEKNKENLVSCIKRAKEKTIFQKDIIEDKSVEDSDPTCCQICLEHRILFATDCGHTLCGKCKNDIFSGHCIQSVSCPQCRHLVKFITKLFIS